MTYLCKGGYEADLEEADYAQDRLLDARNILTAALENARPLLGDVIDTVHASDYRYKRIAQAAVADAYDNILTMLNELSSDVDGFRNRVEEEGF